MTIIDRQVQNRWPTPPPSDMPSEPSVRSSDKSQSMGDTGRSTIILRHGFLKFVWTLGIITAIAATSLFWWRFETTQNNLHALTTATIKLQHAMGYAGFIHNFKNAVLRPEEQRYRTIALKDYTAAVAAIDELEALGPRLGTPIDLTDLRMTLAEYRSKLDLISPAIEQGMTLQQVDALVRVPDAPAEFDLDDIGSLLARNMVADIRVMHNAFLAGALLIGLMMIGLLREVRINHKMQVAHAETIALKLKAETERSHRKALHHSLDRLQQANREQAEFTYAVSHDLKSPLNTARMLVQELQLDDLHIASEEARENLDDLTKVLERMHTNLSDVLVYTRSLNDTHAREPVALDEALDWVLSDLRSEIDAAKATIRRTAPLPTVPSKPHLMRQLLHNLLSNAIKFHAPGIRPLVTIAAAEAPPGLVAFSVSDNGIGIPEEQSDKVFALFGRLHGRDIYDGSGLGLPICQRIAANHGGDVTFASKEGEGCQFTVTMRAA